MLAEICTASSDKMEIVNVSHHLVEPLPLLQARQKRD